VKQQFNQLTECIQVQVTAEWQYWHCINIYQFSATPKQFTCNSGCRKIHRHH